MDRVGVVFCHFVFVFEVDLNSIPMLVLIIDFAVCGLEIVEFLVDGVL